jgi:uncharacterized membrane protein YkoI
MQSSFVKLAWNMANKTATKRILPLAVCVLGAGAMLWSEPALLQTAPIAVAQAQSGPLSLDDAVVKVRRMSGGRVVGADRVEQDGATYYEVKVLLADGRVKVYLVNPDTGEIQD